jgi:XTP/dITP diphosphohydrolase
VVLASRNRGKAAELSLLLTGAPWDLVPLDDAPAGESVTWDENGSSYHENAAIKARAVALGTGMPALADDSGLEVRALHGFPGIHTARWLGDAATEAELLAGIAAKVAELPPTSRHATFVCVLALAVPAGPAGGLTLRYAEGRVEGGLLPEPRGEGGFGYDPIFVPAGQRLTMAEMPRQDKDCWSHRGRAARELLSSLQAEDGEPGR